MTTERECFRNAARTFATARAVLAETAPRAAAEAAHYAGGPSVDELEQRIRRARAESAESPQKPLRAPADPY